MAKLARNEELLQDVHEGRLPLSRIAQKHGIPLKRLQAAVRGERCPSFKRELDELQLIRYAQVHRIACSLIKSTLASELMTGIQGEDENARRCREYVLDRFLPQEAPLPPLCPPLTQRRQRRRRGTGPDGQGPAPCRQGGKGPGGGGGLTGQPTTNNQ